MANQQTRSPPLANEVQNRHIAKLLGTTADKLCPGLKNVFILALLEAKHPEHKRLLEKMAKQSQEFVIPLSKEIVRWRDSSTITQPNVMDYWQKFLHGVQYGYERGPQWDVSGRPGMNIQPSTNPQLMRIPAIYWEGSNSILVSYIAVLWQEMSKHAEKLASQGDPVAIKFLRQKYYQRPVEFLPICEGLEEIRHAHQSNNQQLRSRLMEEIRKIYPEGVPNTMDSKGILTSGHHKKHPAEIEAKKFVDEQYDGAVEHFSKTRSQFTTQRA